MFKLGIFLCSTRPGRGGLAVGRWFEQKAREHGKFELDWVDLLEVNLPPMDEPKHPRFHQYQHDHTKAWSERVNGLDAFVFVTPEYNYGPPPALVNALDYLYGEWHYKPVGFVSYGGVSGGTRSVQMVKQIVTTLKMMPLPEGVIVPFYQQQLDASGAFKGGPPHDDAAKTVLDELVRWTGALKTLRS